MSALLTSLTAVERLAAHPQTLPPELVKALTEDLEYARFGAALTELPCFGSWKVGVDWLAAGDPPRYGTLYREKAPVAFGLKAAELVSNGALVGIESGLAFLAGYFTQLCVARALAPVVETVLATQRKQGEKVAKAKGRIEWAQSLFVMQELHGSMLVGSTAVRTKLEIRKGRKWRGVGRGLYELMRVASQEALGEAPPKPEVDRWMRGLFLFSLALSSPLGKLRAVKPELSKALYRGEGFDVFAAVDRGLEKTREVLTLLMSMVRRNSFSARSRMKFLELCPEGAPEVVARSHAA